MSNHHATAEGNVPFTEEEEIEWAADQVIFAQERSKMSIKAEIAALEKLVTPRRTREAILAIDTTWLTEQEAAIALLRQQL